MVEKRNKKMWKWNNPAKKDLYSGKYGQRIKPVKKDTGPTVKEGLQDYERDKNN
jgi:hypothetical protein|tara:strand:- start:650 stop:811 length:162 start_codon:yes stop_codon:yes gene_type:complete